MIALTTSDAIRTPRETAVTQTDFTHLGKLPKAQQEERLLQLVEGGNKLEAVTLARKLYAYDLVRATEFIEELVHAANRALATLT